MTEADLKPFELLIHALRKEASEHTNEERKSFKCFELHICHNCLHRHVLDWMVLGTANGVCEICGAAADFTVLFAKTTRRKRGI
jgi:hypothetical protein